MDRQRLSHVCEHGLQWEWEAADVWRGANLISYIVNGARTSGQVHAHDQLNSLSRHAFAPVWLILYDSLYDVDNTDVAAHDLT